MSEFWKTLLTSAATGAAKEAALSFKKALGLSDEELRALAEASAEQAMDIGQLVTSADLGSAFDSATNPRMTGAPKRAALLKLAALAIKSAREIKT
jgi:hypothetical protein